ncbi:type I DNA topoisomerase [Candidatus Giovannonibacteria bacterium]|nr:type I DNA topoisomerase [Candidatus Giovannonibacteria bacterium]
MNNLVIVESPTKAKTISRFLGKGFKVESSYGHVRDLPKSNLGIDTEKNFEPKYIIPTKSRKQVNQLKKEAMKSDKIILATDEDREGEAIAWHLITALGLEEKPDDKIERIVFHEITERAIKEALKNPRELDLNLVNSQQARRILDRLVGYKLSPFLWKKVARGLSAGRVQSVAVRLIVEREREIENFKPEEYWTIEAELETKKKEKFKASLHKIGGKTLSKLDIKTAKDADTISKKAEEEKWKVQNVEKKASARSPLPPFTTSTLQQEASRRFGYSAKQTMVIAQQLYEGIDTGEGQVGLITYMRTDSLNLAASAVAEAADFLSSAFGENYRLPKPRFFKTKSKSAQEAHEAIRPSDPARTSESIKNSLDSRQFKIYDLIWRRFLATQMPEAIFDSTIVDVEAGDAIFRATGQVLKFDGFLKVYKTKTEDVILPEITQGDEVKLIKIDPLQHFTQPPGRYSDASLIKMLEKAGIGRPSTYAPTLSTIQNRRYVERDEKKSFHPTKMGLLVNDLLVEHFPEVVDIDFTAKMEAELDEIAAGRKDWQPVIGQFYEPFSEHLAVKYEEVEKQNMEEETDQVCEKCGKKMVIKFGRFGRFLACSGFPECKNTKPLPPVSLNIPCPVCHEGEIVERKTKRGRLFYGCSRYPECAFASWQRPSGELCPKCSSPLVELKGKIKCSSKSCDFEAKEIKKE